MINDVVLSRIQWGTSLLEQSLESADEKGPSNPKSTAAPAKSKSGTGKQPITIGRTSGTSSVREADELDDSDEEDLKPM